MKMFSKAIVAGIAATMVAACQMPARTTSTTSSSTVSSKLVTSYVAAYKQEIVGLKGLSRIDIHYTDAGFGYNQVTKIDLDTKIASDAKCRELLRDIVERSLDYHVESWGNVRVVLYSYGADQSYNLQTIGLSDDYETTGPRLRAALLAAATSASATTD